MAAEWWLPSCADDAAERIYHLNACALHWSIACRSQARLSRKFYERFGDDITTELVDWFNAVDLTYQTQLREMNDLNWERFKSHLDSALTATRAELRGEFRSGLSDLRTGLHTEMGAMHRDLLKWMFIYSSGLLVGLGGLIVGMAVLHP